MPLTPEEKNEYDHKVIYDDLLRRIKSTGKSNSDRITSLDGRLTDSEEVISELKIDTDESKTDISDLKSGLESANTAISGVDTRLSTLESSLGDLDITTKLQFGNGEVLTSTGGKTTVPLGYGMTWRDSKLDTKVRVFTDKATADANAVEGDVLIVPSGSNAVDGIPGATEGKFIYTGNQINGGNSTYIIESTRVGQYYFQKAVDVNNCSYQYVRILNSSGVPNTPESGWRLSYAQWA